MPSHSRLGLLALSLCSGLVFALALSSCGEGSSCRSSDECAGSLGCAGPDDPQVCGIPANEQCSSDADCDPSERCHAIPDVCSPDGVGSECRQPCTDSGCVEGFRCSDEGACIAIPCDEEFECAPHLACDPQAAAAGPVHARAHGCVAISCSEDAVCNAGDVCVNGMCQSGQGTCVEPELVP